MTKIAKQGHRYLWTRAIHVIALESGDRVRVAELLPGQPWFGRVWSVPAFELTPRPMRYFHGEVPR